MQELQTGQEVGDGGLRRDLPGIESNQSAVTFRGQAGVDLDQVPPALLRGQTLQVPEFFRERPGHSQGTPHRIQVHAVTTEGQYNVMLMDLLGTSLEDLFVEHGKKLSLRTVLQVGEQLV